MTYRIHITRRALADLIAIFDYIQQDSPQNARTMIEHLVEAIDDLEFMPARFKIVGRSRKHRSAIHSRVIKPFVVYYRIDEPRQMVFIVEVRHGARQQPRSYE